VSVCVSCLLSPVSFSVRELTCDQSSDEGCAGNKVTGQTGSGRQMGKGGCVCSVIPGLLVPRPPLAVVATICDFGVSNSPLRVREPRVQLACVCRHHPGSRLGFVLCVCVSVICVFLDPRRSVISRPPCLTLGRSRHPACFINRHRRASQLHMTFHHSTLSLRERERERER
jgi:hypothetical protein